MTQHRMSQRNIAAYLRKKISEYEEHPPKTEYQQGALAALFAMINDLFGHRKGVRRRRA